MSQHEIARRLVGGVWTTVDAEEDGGGGGSLPSGGSTGEVLTKESNADGDVGWGPSGGSLPEGESQFDLLGTQGTAPDQPTFTDLLSVHPQLLAEGWRANYDYGAAFGSTANDFVQYLHPTDEDHIFVAEVGTGTFTDVVEPDWSSAPNVGDTVADGSLTWVNAGLFSAFPPTPTTWAAETEYDLPAMVWPTVPNGHLYLMFPPGPLTSDVAEPDFGSIVYGEYVADNDGYWLDAGSAQIAPYTPTWVRQAVLRSPDLISPTAVIIVRDGSVVGGLQLHDEAFGNNIVEWFRDSVDPNIPVSRIYIGDPATNDYLKWDGFGTTGFIIDFDGFTALWTGGAPFLHGEQVDGDMKIRFFDNSPPAARPELPAVPDPQDIADALVALGLVTQASP